jgi:hypothetical protein
MRRHFVQSAPDIVQTVVRQRHPHDLRQSPNDLPVFSGLTRGRDRRQGLLRPTFSIHVCRLFLGVGGTGEYGVGNGRSVVAMMTLVDHEAIFRQVALVDGLLVGPQQPEHFGAVLANLVHPRSVPDVQCCHLETKRQI